MAGRLFWALTLQGYAPSDEAVARVLAHSTRVRDRRVEAAAEAVLLLHWGLASAPRMEEADLYLPVPLEPLG